MEPLRLRSSRRLRSGSHSQRVIGRREACPRFMLARPASSVGQGIYSILMRPVSRYWVVVVLFAAQAVMLAGVL